MFYGEKPVPAAPLMQISLHFIVLGLTDRENTNIMSSVYWVRLFFESNLLCSRPSVRAVMGMLLQDETQE